VPTALFVEASSIDGLTLDLPEPAARVGARSDAAPSADVSARGAEPMANERPRGLKPAAL